MKKKIQTSILLTITLIFMILFIIIMLIACNKKEKVLRDNNEIAFEVLEGHWGHGEQIDKNLIAAGYNPNEIWKCINNIKLDIKEVIKEVEVPTIVPEAPKTYNSVEEATKEEYIITDYALTPQLGVVYYNGHKETYYSQKVLPGGGLNIPGRHVAEDGTIRDADNYICVATDWSFIPYGALVETSLGMGKVYDTGCDYGTVDIYTNW